MSAFTAFASFAWFFGAPEYSFWVSNPAELLLFVTFLVAGLVTGQLTGMLRQGAKEAFRREREAMVVGEILQSALDPSVAGATGALAERLRLETGLAAVVIEIERGSPGTGRFVTGEEAAVRCAALAEPALPQAPGRIVAVEPSHAGPLWSWPRAWWQARRAPRPPYFCRAFPLYAGRERVGVLRVARAGARGPFPAGDLGLLYAVAAQLGAVYERERLRQDMLETEVLRRSDEAKTALLHAVSHDLRSPLASIIAASSSLLEEEVAWSLDERRELAETIARGAARLRQLVDNLLDLSRIEAGTLRPRKEWYDLGLLVDDTLGRLEPVLAQHPMTVTVPDDLPPVPVDYVQIGQVLANLIENAAKHTPPGTRIRLAVVLGEDEVRVEVADSGPGLPPEVLTRVFEPFFRVEGGGRPRGAGLGLAVAKGMVEAHGGRIWAANGPEGGARFVVSLPLHDLDGSAEQAGEVA